MIPIFRGLKLETEKEVGMISLKNGRSTQCMSCAGKNKGRKKNASII